MDRLRWGIIGFGEAGFAFARHLYQQLAQPVAVADLLLAQNPRPSHVQRRLDVVPVDVVTDFATLVANCNVVLSLVTPPAAREVASTASATWQQGLFLDLNSISPMEKRQLGLLFPDAAYVDGAILGSIAGEGTGAPIALSGPRSAEATTALRAIGLRATAIDGEVGSASALKVCRSIFMKGLECLFVETLLAATRLGIAGPVLTTLEETFTAYTPRSLLQMLVTTHAVHCGRRSAEMQHVVDVLADLALPPYMSQAASECLAASYRTGVAEHFGGQIPERVEDVVGYLMHAYREGIAT